MRHARFGRIVHVVGLPGIMDHDAARNHDARNYDARVPALLSAAMCGAGRLRLAILLYIVGNMAIWHDGREGPSPKRPLTSDALMSPSQYSALV